MHKITMAASILFLMAGCASFYDMDELTYDKRLAEYKEFCGDRYSTVFSSIRCIPFETFNHYREQDISMDILKKTLAEKKEGDDDSDFHQNLNLNLYHEAYEKSAAEKKVKDKAERKAQEAREAEQERKWALQNEKERKAREKKIEEEANARKKAMERIKKTYNKPFCKYEDLRSFVVRDEKPARDCVVVAFSGLLKVMQQTDDGTIAYERVHPVGTAFFIEENKKDADLVDDEKIPTAVFLTTGTYKYINAMGTTRTILKLKRLE